MNGKEVTAVAIKFFGIWLIVNIVLYVPSIMLTITAIESDAMEKFGLGFYLAIGLSFVAIGVFASMALFRAANSVLEINGSPDTASINISQEFLLQVGGVYFIVEALSLLPGTGIHVLTDSDIKPSSYLYFSGYLFQLGVGLYLLVKPTVWSQWLTKLRGRA